MNKLTQSHIWQNGLTLQEGPERRLKVFQKEERFQAELRLRLNSLFNNPSLFHLPPNMRIEAAWRLAGRPMSTLSIFTYLLAVWKAATIYGSLFPNWGNNDSCQWHLQATWLASLCISQEGTASRTFIVGCHFYNTCDTTYTLKDPTWRREWAASSPTWFSSHRSKVWKGRNNRLHTQPHIPSAATPTLALRLDGVTGVWCEDLGEGPKRFHVHMDGNMFGKTVLLRKGQINWDSF